MAMRSSGVFAACQLNITREYLMRTRIPGAAAATRTTATDQWKVSKSPAMARRATLLCPSRHQGVYNLCRPKRSFPLGAVQGVEVLRIFIIIQIHRDRLGVKNVVHPVSDLEGESLLDQPGESPERGLQKSYAARDDDQEKHLPKSRPQVRKRGPPRLRHRRSASSNTTTPAAGYPATP